MKKYIGVKQISAEPQVKDRQEGYKVIYEDGYESWSPKEVFEKAYIETGVGVVLGKRLAEHEMRVQRELEDVAMNLTKLKSALPMLKERGTNTTDLEQQAIIMQSYIDILVKRINSFGK